MTCCSFIQPLGISTIFYLERFIEPCYLCSTHGMMEYWNVGMLVFKGIIIYKILNFLVNVNFYNNPCLRVDTHRQALYHSPITHYSIIPARQPDSKQVKEKPLRFKIALKIDMPMERQKGFQVKKNRFSGSPQNRQFQSSEVSSCNTQYFGLWSKELGSLGSSRYAGE